MTIQPIEGSAASTAGQPVRAPKQELDSEVFLQLLVTQLSNQDPSSPMDTNAMIAQTTQLASMERLNALASTQADALALGQRSAAAALVGRTVTTAGTDGAGTGSVTGVVTSVSFSGTEPTVSIDGVPVPYSSISTIGGDAGSMTTTPKG